MDTVGMNDDKVVLLRLNGVRALLSDSMAELKTQSKVPQCRMLKTIPIPGLAKLSGT